MCATTTIQVLETGVRHYDRGLARMEDRWAGQGREGREFEDAAHSYAGDLDLFGRGSLFELLCTAQTRTGEKTLASWLLAPGTPAAIRERQGAARELRDRLDLREDLARLEGDVAKGVRPEDLTSWGGAPPELPTPIRVLARILTAASLTSIALFIAGVTPWPLAITILSILMFNWRVSGRVGRVAHLSERAERELDILAGVLRRVGAETFTTPRLRSLQESIRDAAVAVGRLATLIQRLQATRNEMISAIAGMILWRSHCAFAPRTAARQMGTRRAAVADAVGETEALGALAMHAYENPDDPFLEIRRTAPGLRASSQPSARAAELRRNDVRIARRRS
jgi:hypothetical protein